MIEALLLAERGRRLAHPNPLVGAVVVADERVVGRGYHRGPGTPHAEAAALHAAGDRARGATLYVTLEPCCHHGHTPPCTDAIVAAGVARVVAAMPDPNATVDGRGFDRLREAGVGVDAADDELRRRAEALNEPYVRFMRTGLPLVTLKAAVSLDGKVAAASGDARWISSPESRRRAHEMRAAADAVMVGAGTVRADDPLLTVRDAAGESPARVIVSGRGEMPPESRVFAPGGPPTLVLAEAVSAAREARLRERGVEVLPMGDAGLEAGLRALAERGLLDILCEGGPGLAGSLVSRRLLGRIALFVAPLIVGRGAPDLVAVPAVRAVADALSVEDVSWEILGSDALVRGRVCGKAAAGDIEAG